MSTRRSFLRNCALGAFAFSVLPPAKTYERIWKAMVVPQVNPEWVAGPYTWCHVVRFIYSRNALMNEYQWVQDPPAATIPPNQFCELIVTSDAARELGLT